MKKDKKQSDNWSSLLSDLGLEQEEQNQSEDAAAVEETEIVETVSRAADEERPEPVAAPPAAEAPGDTFGAGLLDEPVAETSSADRVAGGAEEPTTTEKPVSEGSEKTRSGKKSFFDRFPKMNLFGPTPKESLESVVEGTKKSPSLGGKTFTSGTLEKAPHAQGRGKRKKEEPAATEEKNAVQRDAVEAAPEADSNPWSQIAAQVGALSTPTEPESKKESSVRKDPAPKDGGRGRRSDRKGSHRNPPSMFDAPAAESEETATLKNLMEDRDARDGEAEKRLHSMFGERNESKTEEETAAPPREDRPRRGRRGSRFEETKSREDDLAEELFDRFHEKEEEPKPTPKPRQDVRQEEGRGRRGSRYVEQDADRDAERPPRRGSRTRNESEEPVRRREEPAWELDEEPRETSRQESRPRGRGSRSEKSDDRPVREKPVRESGREKAGREPREPAPVVPAQKSVPSWDDAIGVIVSANVARHNQRPRKNGGRR